MFKNDRIYSRYIKVLNNYVEGNTQSLIDTVYNFKLLMDSNGFNNWNTNSSVTKTRGICNIIKETLFVNIPMDPKFGRECDK
jgi:hypothetical protein